MIVPVALFANFIRVLTLILLTYHAGEAAAQGFLHNFAGMFMFAVALMVIYLADEALRPVWLRYIARGEREERPMSERDEAQSGALPRLSRRHFVIGGAMLATSAMAYARKPEAYRPVVDPKVFEGWVPKKFGKWSLVGTSGVVLPPPDSLSDRLYDNLVTRVYASGDTFVMTLIAYNNRQDGVLQVHRPEVCYPVGGYVLTDTLPLPVPVLGRAGALQRFYSYRPRQDRAGPLLYPARRRISAHLGRAAPGRRRAKSCGADSRWDPAAGFHAVQSAR